MLARYKRKAFLRRYGMPIGVGIVAFAIDRGTDILEHRWQLPAGATFIDDVLLGMLVASVAYILQQRFEIASAQLQTFASDVAHQLRTPLAIQRSVGELGLQSSMSATQYQDALESMLEETDRLTAFVDALLVLARMDSGQAHLALTRMRISKLVLEVTSELEVLAQEKSQTLSIDASEDALVEADRAMLRQVFMNLVGNAIKFTPKGGTIAVRTHRLSARRMEVIVSDNGPGIHPDEQERVFERFYRSHPDRDGTGLGLAISKWIVEAHKGKIFCDSILGEGCRFSVQIPTCDISNVTSSNGTSSSASAG